MFLKEQRRARTVEAISSENDVVKTGEPRDNAAKIN